MKKILQLLLATACMGILLPACKKEEQQVVFEGGTNPVLTASNTTNTMVLDQAAANLTAITFNWTNPDFKFNTGVSSRNVTYILQIDTTGANFTNPNKQEVAIANNLSFSPSGKDFNSYFNKMGLKYDMPHEIEFRLKATLVNGSVTDLYSNVIKITVTPYLDVAVPVPADGTLWLTGNAFASGWSNPLPAPYDASQKFTKVSETLYEITVDFVGGGNFKIIQTQGVWGTQYRPKYSADVPFSGGDFERRDADPGWNGPSAAGTYKITMNFITGKYKIEQN